MSVFFLRVNTFPQALLAIAPERCIRYLLWDFQTGLLLMFICPQMPGCVAGFCEYKHKAGTPCSQSYFFLTPTEINLAFVNHYLDNSSSGTSSLTTIYTSLIQQANPQFLPSLYKTPEIEQGSRIQVSASLAGKADKHPQSL